MPAGCFAFSIHKIHDHLDLRWFDLSLRARRKGRGFRSPKMSILRFPGIARSSDRCANNLIDEKESG